MPFGQRMRGLFADGGLRSKIMTSAALFSLVFVVGILVRIVSTVVLTRLLAPEVFGVFAVVFMFIHIIEQFSDIGLRPLILTREGELDDDFLRACWTAQILRGLLILVLCQLIALGLYWGQTSALFPADSSYGDPALPLAVAAIGAYSIFNGFISTRKFVYEREMKFGQVTKEGLISTVTSAIITIALAYWLRSIWALVWGFVAATLLNVFMSYAMYRGARMGLNWDWENFKIIIARGKWVVGQSALSSIISVADKMILGFAMSASTFGFYYIAKQIAELVEQFLIRLHMQMGLQVFTALQEDGEVTGLRRRYYRYRLVFDGLAMFSAGAFLTFAPTLVEIVYDDRYAEVGGMIQIFAVGLVLIGPGLLREAFIAQRQFREMAMLTLVRAVAIWGGLFIAILVFDSVIAALFVVSLHRIPEVIILLVMGDRKGWVSWFKEIRLLPLVLVGMAVGWGMAEAWDWVVT